MLSATSKSVRFSLLKVRILHAQTTSPRSIPCRGRVADKVCRQFQSTSNAVALKIREAGYETPLVILAVYLKFSKSSDSTITDDIAVDNILITWSELLERSTPDQYPIETSQGRDI